MDEYAQFGLGEPFHPPGFFRFLGVRTEAKGGQGESGQDSLQVIHKFRILVTIQK
jgi:hypothetical protein